MDEKWQVVKWKYFGLFGGSEEIHALFFDAILNGCLTNMMASEEIESACCEYLHSMKLLAFVWNK